MVVSTLISSCLLLGILISNKSSSSHRYVQIAHKNIIIEELTTDLNSLQEDKYITLKQDDYPSLLGDFVIELSKSKGVRAYQVRCPNHTCTKQGWINVVNLPIVCIPNQIRIEIVSSSSSAEVSTSLSSLIRTILFESMLITKSFSLSGNIF